MSARASAAKRQRPRLASSAVSSSSFKRACFTHGQRVAMEAGRVTPASSGAAVSQTSQQQRTAVLGPVVSEPPQSPWPVLHTRGGKFRADDAIACMLLKCLPKYQRSDVLRSNEATHLRLCVVSVNAATQVPHSMVTERETELVQFRSGAASVTVGGKRVPLSASGQVFRKHGRAIISTLTGLLHGTVLDVLFDNVYKMFCREVDLSCARLLPASASLPSSLVERLERLSPGWNSSVSADECNRLFGVAMGTARDDLEGVLRWCKHTWLPARLLVLAAVTSSTETRPDGDIITLRKRCPWKAHLVDIEQQLGIGPRTQFVLYPDGHSQWRLCAVPKSCTDRSFGFRRSLPEAWRGLVGTRLEEASEVAGSTFVHPSGGFAGNATFIGASQMAVKALAEKEEGAASDGATTPSSGVIQHARDTGAASGAGSVSPPTVPASTSSQGPAAGASAQAGGSAGVSGRSEAGLATATAASAGSNANASAQCTTAQPSPCQAVVRTEQPASVVHTAPAAPMRAPCTLGVPAVASPTIIPAVAAEAWPAASSLQPLFPRGNVGSSPAFSVASGYGSPASYASMSRVAAQLPDIQLRTRARTTPRAVGNMPNGAAIFAGFGTLADCHPDGTPAATVDGHLLPDQRSSSHSRAVPAARIHTPVRAAVAASNSGGTPGPVAAVVRPPVSSSALQAPLSPASISIASGNSLSRLLAEADASGHISEPANAEFGMAADLDGPQAPDTAGAASGLVELASGVRGTSDARSQLVWTVRSASSSLDGRIDAGATTDSTPAASDCEGSMPGIGRTSQDACFAVGDDTLVGGDSARGRAAARPVGNNATRARTRALRSNQAP